MRADRSAHTAAVCLFIQEDIMDAGQDIIWYRQPASVWTEALPQGNGRIGTMTFGGTGEERICLNEDTLWSGIPSRSENPGAPAAFR